jgi:hypothetical protein
MRSSILLFSTWKHIFNESENISYLKQQLQWTEFLLHIKRIWCSNLGPHPGYSSLSCSVVFLTPFITNAGILSHYSFLLYCFQFSIRARASDPSPTQLFIHYSFIIQSFHPIKLQSCFSAGIPLVAYVLQSYLFWNIVILLFLWYFFLLT